jgi:ATP-dependent Clp protease adaptor protein ClpS
MRPPLFAAILVHDRQFGQSKHTKHTKNALRRSTCPYALLRYRPALPYFMDMHLSPIPLTITLISPNAIRSADDNDGNQGNDNGVGIATKTLTKTKKPSPYKVLLLNDDYTPMEFVVQVLKRFFGMDIDEATRVMLHVHQKGVGICGIFSYEVAETKVTQVMDFARKNQHPLQCMMEKA